MDDTMSKVRFAAIGLNHFHIYGQIDLMLRAGAEFAAYCGEEEKFFDRPFAKHYPQARRVEGARATLEAEPPSPVPCTAVTMAGSPLARPRTPPSQDFTPS